MRKTRDWTWTQAESRHILRKPRFSPAILMLAAVAMMMLAVVLLAATKIVGQEVQIHEVRDFSGGLVNSVANALMQDNQLTVMENYDLDPFGNLRRRPGLELHFNDTLNDEIDGLFTYYSSTKKQLLLIRTYDDFSGLDPIILNGTARIALCNDTTETCTTLVMDTLYSAGRDTRNRKWPISRAQLNENIIIAGVGREAHIYDGSTAFPLRILGPGQPKAVAIDSGGNLTGTFSYRIAFRSKAVVDRDTSHLSAASWPVTVKNGRVFLSLIPADSTRAPFVSPAPVEDEQGYYIITRKQHDVDTSYRFIAEFDALYGDTTVFLDNDNTPGDYVPYKWGFCTAGLWDVTLDDSIPTSPGTMNLYFYTTGGAEGLFHYLPVDSLDEFFVMYRVTYVDSSGNESISSPVAYEARQSSPGSRYLPTTWTQVRLYSIPVSSNPKVTSKVIYRNMNYSTAWPDTLDHDTMGYWYILDTIENDERGYIDTKAWNEATKYCDVMEFDPHLFGDSNADDPGLLPEEICVDGELINFKPVAVTKHGSRLYAISNPDYLHRLYYSDFGRPSIYASDGFIDISSTSGDWFQQMLSLSNDKLLLLRQHSAAILAGLSYYQYSTDEIISRIGLTAPRTLVAYNNHVYFAERGGLYDLARLLAGDAMPTSFVIDNTVDSFNNHETSMATLIDGECWWSVPIGDSVNNKLYIWSELSKPHWRNYTFGFDDAVAYDSDTSVFDYRGDKYILLGNNDTLYRWGYDRTLDFDPPDTTTFSATVKTKAFLEGPGRKKILWFELLGEGSPTASWTMTFFDKLGADSVGVQSYILDFDSNVDNRRHVNEIVEDFSVRITDNGNSNHLDYTITGIRFGWIPWDEGKRQ